MRIVHLSDIHLSKDNYDDFENDYIPALIKDLTKQGTHKAIDLIVITGDLVDRGGHSLLDINDFKDKNPFEIFEKVFIDPICQQVGLPKSNILFVPGNHDVDESEILLVEEQKLEKELNEKTINKVLQENNVNFRHSKRIEKFKIFEGDYHHETPNYYPTNNQSTFHYTSRDGLKVGFILINDSWRCKSIQLWSDPHVNKGDHKHYLGVKQFRDGLNALEQQQTDVNICLMHHEIDCFKDKEEIERVLVRLDIDLVLFGHYHKSKFLLPKHIEGQYLSLRCRASNDVKEKNSDYVSGYQIIDIENNYVNQILYRLYIHDKMIFVDDSLGGLENGVYNGAGKGIKLHDRVNIKEKRHKEDFQN